VTTPFPQARKLPKTQVEYDAMLREAWMNVRKARHDLSRIVSVCSEQVALATVKCNDADVTLTALMATDRAKLPHDTA
jgi:hypothetical protein